MSTKELKDRVHSVIQRDRLANFLKESVKQDSGCFYYALIGVFNALYPNEIISREAENRILNLDPSLDCSPSEFIDRLHQLEDILKIKVSQIEITCFAIDEPQDLRNKVPENIPISKKEEWLPKRLDSQSSAIIVWRNRFDPSHVGHATSLDRIDTLLGKDGDTWNIGGQEGINYLMSRNYLPTIVFHISKKK